MGLFPNGNIGFGRLSVNGLNLFPRPPAIITHSNGSWDFILFRSIIEYKFHLEQSSSQDPVNINKLKNIKLYIQSQNIDKYEVIDDVNKKLSIQRIISILIQTNILALIIIFIFRIRLML